MTSSARLWDCSNPGVVTALNGKGTKPNEALHTFLVAHFEKMFHPFHSKMKCECRISLDLSRVRWFGGFLFATKGPSSTTLSLVFGCKFHRKEIVKLRTPGLPMVQHQKATSRRHAPIESLTAAMT